MEHPGVEQAVLLAKELYLPLSAIVGEEEFVEAVPSMSARLMAMLKSSSSPAEAAQRAAGVAASEEFATNGADIEQVRVLPNMLTLYTCSLKHRASVG